MAETGHVYLYELPLMESALLSTSARSLVQIEFEPGPLIPERPLGAGEHRVTVVSRGPKPLPVLRELGARAQVVVPEPNTWKEIVEAVAARPERRIAVQEYGRPNLEMNAALEQLGASVTPIVLYGWELPVDIVPLHKAARGLAERQFDAILFTSSIRLDHLMMIARDLRLQNDVYTTLCEYTASRPSVP